MTEHVAKFIRKISIFNIVIMALLSLECAIDTTQRFVMVDEYVLNQWEGGWPYYITRSYESVKGGGLLEGKIEYVGWDGKVIIARRIATAAIDMDGWMVINVMTDNVAGPYSDDEFQELRRLYYSNVTIRHVKDAWDWLDANTH